MRLIGGIFFSKLQRDRYSVGITTRTRDDIINPVSATNIFQASHATPPVPSLSVAHFWNALIERLAHPRAARRDRWFNASLSIVRCFLALAGSRLRKATCTWTIRFFRQALSSLSPREHRKRCSMKENNRYGVSMNDVAYRGSSGRAHFTRLLTNFSCNSRSRQLSDETMTHRRRNSRNCNLEFSASRPEQAWIEKCGDPRRRTAMVTHENT